MTTTYRAERRDELEAFLAGNGRLHFPRPTRPRATVVVVTWNQAELVLSCLVAVRDECEDDTEVIVIDNGSSDSTPSLLGRTEGAELLRNDTNDGFLLAANRAARSAGGDTIVFVNSDAVLQPGALEALVGSVECDDTIGMAGGRLIDVNGRLQEAGGRVFSDGTVQSIGAGDDPWADAYASQRDVDYCSGALLAVDAATWHSLGGFDERYAPAYYEDVDLCLRAKATGQRVVYEPGASAHHVGFGSGVDLASARALADRNRRTLVESHRELLDGQPRPLRVDRQREGAATPRRAFTVGVPHYLTGLSRATGHGRIWRTVLDGLREHAVVRAMDPSHARGEVDVWLADGYQGAPGVDVPCVVELHEAAWDEPATRATVDPQRAATLDSGAKQALDHADQVITLSEHSRRDIVGRYQVAPARVHAVAPGVDLDTFKPGLDGGIDLIREAGGSDAPYIVCVSTAHPRKNLAALRAAVVSLAERGLPHQLALIVSEVRDDPRSGRYLAEAVAPLPGWPGRQVRVECPTDEELAAVLAGAEAFCLPSLMEGFGIPVLEAMASGTPVVASNRGPLPEVVGAAGLIVEPTVAHLAQALARVLTDAPLADRLAAAGSERAEAFSWSRAVSRWERILRRAAAGGAQSQSDRRSEGRGAVGSSIYSRAVDPDTPNNAHSYLVEMTGFNKRVLELGCSAGHITEALAARGCTVVGVELDPEAAEAARKYAERVVVGDLESLDEEIAGQYDVIMCGDVLEHLRDPLGVLRRVTRYLAPDGYVVVSLPNVVHADVRLRMWQGEFPYGPIGLLDNTHLRFFTAQSMREMFAEAGLLITETRRVIVPVFGSELAPAREDVPTALIEEMLRDSEAETYQFVVSAVRDNGVTAVTKALERLAQLEEHQHDEDVRAAKAQLIEGELKTLQAEHARLVHHAAAVEAELEKAGGYARSLEAQVAATKHAPSLIRRLGRRGRRYLKR